MSANLSRRSVFRAEQNATRNAWHISAQKKKAASRRVSKRTKAHKRHTHKHSRQHTQASRRPCHPATCRARRRIDASFLRPGASEISAYLPTHAYQRQRLWKANKLRNPHPCSAGQKLSRDALMTVSPRVETSSRPAYQAPCSPRRPSPPKAPAAQVVSFPATDGGRPRRSATPIRR